MLIFYQFIYRNEETTHFIDHMKKITKKNIIKQEKPELRSEFMEWNTCHKMSNESLTFRKYFQN